MEQFNDASLVGTYAVANIGHGGQTPQAGVSVATYDGKGSFSGVTIQDVPGHTFTERVFVTVPFTGTYSVSESGEGAGSITTKMPDGSTHEVRIDYGHYQVGEEKWRYGSREIRLLRTSSCRLRQIFSRWKRPGCPMRASYQRQP